MGRSELSADVVIIGGGIVGCASAYYLARRGLSVILLEKSTVGSEASGRNAGGVRAQCRDRRERLHAMASIEIWKTLEDELGLDVEYVQGGNIRLATTEERMDALAREAEEELADGLYVELWDRTELRRRAPYLSDRFIGAKYCPTDGVANPILASRAFGWAARRAGVTLLEHTEAREVVVKGGRVTAVHAHGPEGEVRVRASWVIHAGGPWTPELAGTLDLNIPIRPQRAVMAVTEPVSPFFTEFVSSHDVRLYARPARSGHIHVGVHSEPDPTFDKRTPRQIVQHLARLDELIPALARVRILRTWAGTLAMTPDGIPVVGPVPGIQGYLLAAGFCGHGFCLGPIMGKLLSELVVDGRPSLSLDAFSPHRFHASS